MSTLQQAGEKRNLKPLWIALAFASLIIIIFFT